MPEDKLGTPVVFIPGSTGTKLRDRSTGKIVWGSGNSLVGPIDGGYAIALPVAGQAEVRDRVVADAVIDEIRLAGIIRKDIYGPLLRLLTSNGYRLGDLDEPRPDQTFFTYPYDWRQGTVAATRQLLEKLDHLRRLRGEERLRVILICQSTGVNLGRYLVKYGGCSLADAAAGRSCVPDTVSVSKLILIAPSTGGSLRTMLWFNRGRRYLHPFFRKWRPETIFTFFSLYQDLPVYRPDLFLDEAGEPLDIDLYDARSWQTYGWSVYRRKVQRRLGRNRHPELFAGDEQRAAYLQRALDHARQLHELLGKDVAGFGATRYYLLRSTDQETPERVVLLRRKGRWQTVFPAFIRGR
jgi:hypothetical protein